MNKQNRFVRPRVKIGDEQRSACEARLKAQQPGGFRAPPSAPPGIPLPLNHAVCVKSAELWLRLGEPLEALSEIENVPHSFRRNIWLHRLHVIASREAQKL